MNKFQGKITHIETSGALSIVTVQAADHITLKAIVIETPETANYMKLDYEVSMMFKETEVVIGTAPHHKLSLQNKISGRIIKLEKDKLLSKVTIESSGNEITSIISTQAVIDLDLKEEMEVMAMIKLNEVMISDL